VLPLGIRGDGGVRASILLMPEDESEEEYDSADDQAEIALDEANQASLEPDERLSAVVSAGDGPDAFSRGLDKLEDGQTSSSSGTEEGLADLAHHGHHHLVPPDPLLAAVGAGQMRSEADRMSPTSWRRNSMDWSVYARSSGAGDADGEADAPLTRRMRSVLSDSLWMVWSHWTRALVAELVDLLEDRLAQHADGADTASDSSAALVPDVAVVLVVQPADMAALGLSAGSRLDVELVETLGACYLARLVDVPPARVAVRVNKGWSLLRWLL
jgi:hypothetical protein